MHQDDPLMNQHYMEWLYFTGILRDSSGAMWGYEITLWQSMIPPHSKPLFMYDVALSDLTHQHHIMYRAMPSALRPNDLGAIRQESDTWIYEHPGGLTLRHDESEDIWTMDFTGVPDGKNAGQPPLQISVELVNDKSGYYPHSPDGLLQMGRCAADRTTLDGYTYYYTHPALTTRAKLIVDQQTIVLSGDTWFDHQWGNFNDCLMNWNWFSLRLNDGTYIMIFQFCDDWGTPLSDPPFLSVIDPAGRQQTWTEPGAVTLTPVHTWIDPRTGVSFPLAWTITTPQGTYGFEAAFDEQVMPPLPKLYWEGVMTVREGGLDGAPIGMGYLEVAR
jgi:predicted secreted hydrolase